MKKSLIYLFAFLALGAFCGELKVDAPQTITESVGKGGTLQLEGKFALKDISPWFYVRFTGADGKTLCDFRFDGKMLYIPQLGCQDKYLEAMHNVPNFKLTAEVSANGTCYLILNGIPLVTKAFPKNALPTKISLIPFDRCKPVFVKAEWDGKTPAQRIRIQAPKGKTQGVSAAKLPQGPFELKYKFKVEMLIEQPGHFNIQLTSRQKGTPGVQLIFWKKGFQMINGKSSKWLYNFPTPIADGKWHEFKLRHTAEDFWETWLDGKSAGSFDADVQPGELRFGAYSGWIFEAEDISIQSVSNGDKQ